MAPAEIGAQSEFPFPVIDIAADVGREFVLLRPVGKAGIGIAAGR